MLKSPLRSGSAAASFVRLAKHRAHGRCAAQLRWKSKKAVKAVAPAPEPPKTLASKAVPSLLSFFLVGGKTDTTCTQYPRRHESTKSACNN